MAEHSGPWSTGAGLSVDQWSQMMGAFLGFGASTTGVFGVAGDPGSSDLLGFGDATGLQVKLAIGQGIVDGQWYYNDTQQTLAIGSNSSGSTRIDRLVIRRSTGSSVATALIIPGTVPATPPPVTNQDLMIAQVVVTNGAVTITAANVVDERVFIPRGVLPVSTAGALPSAPFFGQITAQNNALKFWDGTEWEYLNYDSGWVALDTNRSGGHGWIPLASVPTKIRRYGETVRLTGFATQGSAAPTLIMAAGTIPVSMQPASEVSFSSVCTSGKVVQVFVFSDGSVSLDNSGNYATAAVPVGDNLPLDGAWLVG